MLRWSPSLLTREPLPGTRQPRRSCYLISSHQSRGMHEALVSSAKPGAAELAGLRGLPQPEVPRQLRGQARPAPGPHDEHTRPRACRPSWATPFRRGGSGRTTRATASTRSGCARVGHGQARPGARQRRRHRRSDVPRPRRRHRHDGRAVRCGVQSGRDDGSRAPARGRACVQPVGGRDLPGEPRASRRSDRGPDPRRPRRRHRRDPQRPRRRPAWRHHHPAAVGRPRVVHELQLRPRVGGGRRSSTCPCTATPVPARTRTTAKCRAG